jgi:hypothetical protein
MHEALSVLAACIDCGIDNALDLAGGLTHPTREPLKIVGDMAAVPEKPSLGVDIDVERIEKKPISRTRNPQPLPTRQQAPLTGTLDLMNDRRRTKRL